MVYFIYNSINNSLVASCVYTCVLLLLLLGGGGGIPQQTKTK